MEPLAALRYRTNRASYYARNKLYCYVVSRKKINLADTIFITGSGRSGTTWLAELLTVPGYCLIHEPDDLRKDLYAAGFRRHSYQKPDTTWESGQAAFTKIFMGKRLNNRIAADHNLRQILTCQGLVVKSIRAGGLLPWLSNHFTLRGFIHIIRHPCAVIYSMMKHAGLKDEGQIINDTIIEYLEQYRPDLIPKLEKWTSEEEIRTVKWCFHQYIPLKHEPKRWHTIVYEKLVQDGTKEANNICSYLNISPDLIIAKLNNPSSETQSWSANPSDSLEIRLGGWKKNMSKEQISKILNVVDTFGIEGYGDNIFPDFDKIGVSS